MNNLIPCEYSVDWPYISVLCADINNNKVRFGINAEYMTAEEAWKAIDDKILEYNMKSEKDIHNMTMAEYAHYRQVYFADNPSYASRNGILYDKYPEEIKSYRKPFTKSIEQKTYATPVTNIESPKNYEYYYWGFVKAETQDAADAMLNSMIERVTLDLQPRPDGKSWVEDPRPVGVSKEFTEKWPKRKRELPTWFWPLLFVLVVSGISSYLSTWVS